MAVSKKQPHVPSRKSPNGGRRFPLGDPHHSASLAILYAELARAQAEHDAEAAQFARRAIEECLRPESDDPIDEPLVLPAKRSRSARPASGKVA